MILGALIGFAIWFCIFMLITGVFIAVKVPAPSVTATGCMKAFGFSAVGALIGHLI